MLYKKIIPLIALIALSVPSLPCAAANNLYLRGSLYVPAAVGSSCAFSGNVGGSSGAQINFNFGDITSRVGENVSATTTLAYVCAVVGAAPKLALKDNYGLANTTTFDLRDTSCSAGNVLPFTIVQTGGSTPFVNSPMNFQAVLSNPISLTATILVPPNLSAGTYTDTIYATLTP